MTRSARHQGSHSAQVLVEVRPLESSGDLAPRVAVPEDFRRRASEIADSIGEVADQFRARLEKVFKRPHEDNWGVESVEIEFGLAVKAEAGVLIAKASGGATFTARLTLKPPPAKP
jgi:hypothetical protein